MECCLLDGLRCSRLPPRHQRGPRPELLVRRTFRQQLHDGVRRLNCQTMLRTRPYLTQCLPRPTFRHPAITNLQPAGLTFGLVQGGRDMLPCWPALRVLRVRIPAGLQATRQTPPSSRCHLRERLSGTCTSWDGRIPNGELAPADTLLALPPVDSTPYTQT